jgi:putative ABC transport system permease protein
MTLNDLLLAAVENLWRMKLRAFLTISGVVIAIAAFVSMMSFGAGNQQYVTEQFNKLGLFLPGVDLVYPYDAFSATITMMDTQMTAKAQALPRVAIETKIFSQLKAGSLFDDDSCRQVIVTDELLESIGIDEPDSILGQQLTITVKLADLDSGLVNVFQDEDRSIRKRLEDVWIDSLLNRGYQRKLIRQELQAAIKRFLDGYMNSPAVVTDTFTICGVLKAGRGRRIKIESVMMPTEAARQFTSGINVSLNPADMMATLSRGVFPTQIGSGNGKSYPQLTINLDPSVSYEIVKDSVEALGFTTFSFAEQFDEFRRAMLYFNLALAAVGLIALTTASLGIINTMVMSIIERTREIGVLKSLGADDRHIRFLFLVESGVIGSIGAIVGIIFGWIITRVASAIAHMIMEREGIDPIELFALPIWLIATAFLFGLIVSLIAGTYPAYRAARVDPVRSLRGE